MMKNKKYITLLLALLFSLIVHAQKPRLFIGTTAHLGNGKVIKNSAISTKNGKFEMIADAELIRIDPSAFDTIIRLHGKHIYPSFIVPNTTLGITEIGAVRASNDYRETGGLNPNVRALIAYNTDSKITKTVRTNGVLIAQITPRGGVISGQSSVMHLDGWNWEDAQLKSDDGIHLNWPSSYYSTGWWAEPGTTKENKEYNTKTEEIRRLFNKALAYANSSKIMDLKMESMKGLFNGSKTLYIHANKSNDMRDAIEFSNKFKIKKMIIVGGEDALKITNLLQEAGILFCLSYSGSMEAMGARNLPFSAGTTVAYGQTYENAIMSITLNTAQILGVDSMVGSIETGKDATFFISTGDALDMRTNNVEHAFIKGKTIDLNNHQKELFNKYNNR